MVQKKNNLNFENQIQYTFHGIGMKNGQRLLTEKYFKKLIIELKKIRNVHLLENSVNINLIKFFETLVSELSPKVSLKKITNRKIIPVLLNKENQSKETLKIVYLFIKKENIKNLKMAVPFFKKLFLHLSNEKWIRYQNWEKEKYNFYKKSTTTFKK